MSELNSPDAPKANRGPRVPLIQRAIQDAIFDVSKAVIQARKVGDKVSLSSSLSKLSDTWNNLESERKSNRLRLSKTSMNAETAKRMRDARAAHRARRTTFSETPDGAGTPPPTTTFEES